jgi:hypothetical protein
VLVMPAMTTRLLALVVAALALIAWPMLADAKGGKGGGKGGGHGRAAHGHVAKKAGKHAHAGFKATRGKAAKRSAAKSRGLALRGVAVHGARAAGLRGARGQRGHSIIAGWRGGARASGLLLYPALAWPGLYSGLFWPEAYYDVWPYRYDTIIGGAFAYDDRRYRGRRTYDRAYALQEPVAMARLCQQDAYGSPDETVGRIARTVGPNEQQQRTLEELRSAIGDTTALLRDACPADIPLSPIARLDVIGRQIDVVQRAFGILRPSLETFERSLSEQQRARFVAMSAHASRRTDLERDAEVCGQVTAATRFPLDRIAEAVRPGATQGNALTKVSAASDKAAGMLAANCPREVPATPLGRLQSMEQRLEVASQAVETVREAMADFYASLSDEQKARFNQLNSSGLHARR